MLYCIPVLTSISGAWEQRQGEANDPLKSHRMISNVGAGPFGFIQFERLSSMLILASKKCSFIATISKN